MAAELAVDGTVSARERCLAFREALLSGLAPLGGVVNGDLGAPSRTSSTCRFRASKRKS